MTGTRGAGSRKKAPAGERRGKKAAVRGVCYEVYYKGRKIQQDFIDMEDLPVQFGRERGMGNDVIVAPEGVPEEGRRAISRAWFYIQRDMMGELQIYSAEASNSGSKKASDKKKLVLVADDQKLKLARAAALKSELVLKAEEIVVILRIQDMVGGKK